MGNETKPNGPKIGYGVLEKGNEYSRSRYAKPDSSNAASIILDTGKDLIKGRCYDHHQLSQEDKARFPSATSMVYEYAQDIYDVNKAAIDNGQRIDLVCHDFPDTDAILSVVLAKQILENGGELPVGAEQLVRYANESDTFTFKPGFGFGAMLTTIINEEYPKARSFMQKKDAIDTCVCFTETILEEYQKLVAKEQDPEKRAEIDFDSTLASMMDQRSDYRRRQQANWRYFNKCKDQIDKKTLTSIKAMRNLINDLSSKGSEYNNGEITARDKNSKNAFASQDHIGYEIFDVRLCKKQLTKEEPKSIMNTDITTSEYTLP